MLLSPRMPRSSPRRSWEQRKSTRGQHQEELGGSQLPTKMSEEEEEAGSDEEEEVARLKLKVKFLGEMLQDMRSITERLLDADIVMERDLKFKRGLDDVRLPYKELHRNLWKSARQLSIMDFFLHWSVHLRSISTLACMVFR